MDAQVAEEIKNITIGTGGILAAVMVLISVAKTSFGMAGKYSPALAVVLGIAGSWLVISKDPAVFLITGIIIVAGEKGLFSAAEDYVTKQIQKDPEKSGLQELKSDLVVKEEGQTDIIVDAPLTIDTAKNTKGAGKKKK